ncbi:hypothetical protein BD310DRAFT_1005179 [Dichomitus squalens]|uniref:Uncharacterized protein n=1 Tax=Dichomitus squalens TaxID=114155 RepID=A0A4Q9PE49_9APHY|nr:hypothetical protein BD310DRAFT_1005179 [Dichomitus squalens]
MGEICLSVAPNLRCQSLTRTEAGILLVPPGLEIIFAVVLLWAKRGADKKHVFIAAEVFIYFLLAVLDVFTHTLPTIGTSLDSFRSLDIIIGAASFIPLFLYMFSIYLLTTAELIPSLPIRFQSITKYVLLAFIPLVIVLNELGSFIGITYRQFPGTNGGPIQLGVGFTDPTPEMFLSSVTLVLFVAFQASNFCIAFYRLIRALSHQRTLDSSQQEKEMETHLFRGLGWIVAGLKLGAVETVIGFAQGGFGVVFTRRLLRLLAHGCLIIGIIKGVDTVEDFQLYSPGQAQKRRKSMLRAMIQNPRFSTFRHVGGHDFSEKNPFDEKRQSVIKLGDPSWMRRDFGRPAAIEEERATPGLLSRTHKTSSLTFQLAARPTLSRRSDSVRDSAVSFGSSARSSYSDGKNPIDEYADVQEDTRQVDVSTFPAPVPRVGLPARPVRQRVTVHIRQDRLPVLELRRFSNLEFLDLIQDPFRDPHVRARSLPNDFEPAPDHPAGRTSASFTRLPPYVGAPAPAAPPAVARDASIRGSLASRHSRASSLDSYNRLWRGASVNSESNMPSFDPRLSYASTDYNPRMSTASWSYSDAQPGTGMSFTAIGSPTDSISSFVSPNSLAPPVPFAMLKSDRRDKGLSSSTTASEVHALTMQFPGIPSRHFSQPARRSMLSQEVSRDDFVVDADEPMPMPPAAADAQSSAPSPVVVSQTPSPRRKSPPAPLITSGLKDSRISNVEIEQVVDEETAVASLPTPMSPPQYVPSRTLAHGRLHSTPHVADVPVTATSVDEEDSDDAGLQEVPIVRSASLVRRGTDRGKLVRMKSVGHAPVRSVSASAREQSMARDSIKVELGLIARGGREQMAEVMMYDPAADTQV